MYAWLLNASTNILHCNHRQGQIFVKYEGEDSDTDHVSESDGGVLDVVLHQRVVMGGEQGPAADLLWQLVHHSARDGCAVIRGRTSACSSSQGNGYNLLNLESRFHLVCAKFNEMSN